MHYGPHNSRLTPRTYTITFMCSDFIALVLQSAGGGIADQGTLSASARNGGVHLMVAGLSFQVLSILIFIGLCAEFFWRVKNERKQTGRAGSRDAASRHYKLFIFGKSPSSPSTFLISHADKHSSIHISHLLHPRPFPVPCRRIGSRLQWQASERPSHVHDP
jgi:hypothetical protein